MAAFCRIFGAALLVGSCGGTSAVEQDPTVVQSLGVDDECNDGSDSELCSLSFRQLRGEMTQTGEGEAGADVRAHEVRQEIGAETQSEGDAKWYGGYSTYGHHGSYGGYGSYGHHGGGWGHHRFGWHYLNSEEAQAEPDEADVGDVPTVDEDIDWLQGDAADAALVQEDLDAKGYGGYSAYGHHGSYGGYGGYGHHGGGWGHHSYGWHYLNGEEAQAEPDEAGVGDAATVDEDFDQGDAADAALVQEHLGANELAPETCASCAHRCSFCSPCKPCLTGGKCPGFCLTTCAQKCGACARCR